MCETAGIYKLSSQVIGCDIRKKNSSRFKLWALWGKVTSSNHAILNSMHARTDINQARIEECVRDKDWGNMCKLSE